MDILLLHPPQAKPAEPPAGLPLLAAALRAHGCRCQVLDLNIEGLYSLMATEPATNDTWSKRAVKARFRHLDSLTDRALYSQPARYRRAVADLSRVMEICGRSTGIQLSLANYQDTACSPLSSDDLLACAERYRHNLYFPMFSARLRHLFAQSQPRFVGISLNYLSQAHTTFAILGFLHQEFPAIRPILGGGLVTTWLQLPGWQNPFGGLAELVAGPGEVPLIELVRGSPPKQRVAPDYDDLRDNRYLAPGFILPYAASTGCFWRKCSFCPETSEKNRYRPVPPAQARAELAMLLGRYRPSLVHLLDNAVSPALLQTLIDVPIATPWYGFARFTPALADPEYCRQLARAGCAMLKLGLESGSQIVLDRMDKGISLQLAARALAALKAAGISTYVYLLFGTPAESLAEARQTLEFVRSRADQITFLNLAIFNLPVGSREADELATTGLYQGDLSIYTDFVHPRGWGRREIRRFLDQEFKRDPAIQRILANDPPLFTSNHAPLFKERQSARHQRS